MRVHKTKVGQLLNELDGKFATVEFTKKDGSIREMNLRFGVHKGVKGSNRTPTERYDTPYRVAYDVKSKGYRTINLSTISKIKANGLTYHVL